METLRADLPSGQEGGPWAWCSAFDQLLSRYLSKPGQISLGAWWGFLDDCVTDLATSVPLSGQGAYIAFRAAVRARTRYAPDLDALAARFATEDAMPSPFGIWALAQCAEQPRQTGDYEAAVRWLYRADSYAKRLPLELDDAHGRAGRAILCLQHANLHLELGQHAEAIRQADRATELLQSMDEVDLSPTEAARTAWIADQVLLNRASILSAIGLHHSVLRALDQPVLQSADPVYKPYFQQLQAVSMGRLGRAEEACELLDELVAGGDLRPRSHALALNERVLLELDRGRHVEALALAEVGAAHFQKHPDLVVLDDRLRTLQALARWRGSGQPMDRQAAIEAARSAMDGMLEAGLGVPVNERAAGFLTYAPRRIVPGVLVSLLLADPDATAGREAALDVLLEVDQLGVLGRRLGAPVATAERLRQSLLSGSGGLLFYFPAWRSCHVFALTKERLLHAELPGLATLKELLGEARLALGDPATESTHPALMAASRAIFPPEVMIEMSTWSSLTVVGAGLLQHAAVSAFPVPLGPGGASIPLGLALPLTELPSCSVGLALAARGPRTSPASGHRLVIGNPAPASLVRYQLSPVHFPDSARQRIPHAEIADGPAARMTGGQASPRTLTLFAHGVLDPLRARPMGLLLPRDQGALPWFADDIESAWPDGGAPRVVVLAACGAGRSPLRVGDDDSGTLGAAFFAAGTDCCLSSPVALEQEATAILVAEFLLALTESDESTSPAQALLIARRALVDSERFHAPHYWATLTPVGLGHSPLVSR